MPTPKSLIPPLFVVLWSTGFIGARFAMPWAEPFTFLALRFGIAGLLLAAIACAYGGPALTARQRLSSVTAGILMHGVYLGGVFWAVKHGLTAGMSALIVGLQPLITVLLARPLLGEAVRPRQWIGLGLGLAGVVIVVLPKLGLGGFTAPTLAAAVLAVFGMSLGTVLQKWIASGGDLLRGTAWQYAGATVVTAVGSLLLETRTMAWNGELVFAMAWLVFVLSIGAIFLLMVMIRDGEVGRLSSLFYLVPAVTALMGWALFGETLTPVQIVGMAVATVGVALAVAQFPTRARASR
jgi:drug/metabolite transporter (DMT)-like permease